MSKPTKDYQQIINQLENLQEHCKDMAKPDAGEIWQADVDALHEAMDIIHDYEQVVADHNRMVEQYETSEMAIKRQAGIYVCPLCGKRVQVGHSHCHWCGKKVHWDREAYASRDYPHMKRGGERE